MDFNTEQLYEILSAVNDKLFSIHLKLKSINKLEESKDKQIAGRDLTKQSNVLKEVVRKIEDEIY